MTNEKKIESVESVESVEIEATNKGQTMTNEKKQVEVKAGFKAAEYFDGFSTRYGWSSSIGESNNMEQFEDCFADAMAHGLGYVEVEFYVQDFNEIWLFLTFSPRPRRGRISVKSLLQDNYLLEDFFFGVMGFIDNDLKPINADTSLAMKWLYDGERYNDYDLHCAASDLATRLDEIARSWIECLKGSATDEEKQRIEGNATLETCEMTRWGKLVEEIISRKTHKNN